MSVAHCSIYVVAVEKSVCVNAWQNLQNPWISHRFTPTLFAACSLSTPSVLLISTTSIRVVPIRCLSFKYNVCIYVCMRMFGSSCALRYLKRLKERVGAPKFTVVVSHMTWVLEQTWDLLEKSVRASNCWAISLVHGISKETKPNPAIWFQQGHHHSTVTYSYLEPNQHHIHHSSKVQLFLWNAEYKHCDVHLE